MLVILYHPGNHFLWCGNNLARHICQLSGILIFSWNFEIQHLNPGETVTIPLPWNSMNSTLLTLVLQNAAATLCFSFFSFSCLSLRQVGYTDTDCHIVLLYYSFLFVPCKLCFLSSWCNLFNYMCNFHLWNLKLKTTFQYFPWSASILEYFFHSCIFYIFLHISSWLLLQCMQVFFSGTRWDDSGLETEGMRIRNKLENL